MFRALLEILFTIAVVLIARAVLTSILKGIARASADSLGRQSQAPGRRGSEAPESELGGNCTKTRYAALMWQNRRHSNGKQEGRLSTIAPRPAVRSTHWSRDKKAS